VSEQATAEPGAEAPELENVGAEETSAALPQLGTAMTGEFVGTFILVFFGVGAVNAAVVTGAQVGLWQVAVVWAVGVSLGIYASASLSGAHINPAITASMAAWGGFPASRVR
jgi:glycerol uptake facilitator protein